MKSMGYIAFSLVVLAALAALPITQPGHSQVMARLSAVSLANNTDGSCVPAPSDLVSWWPADGDALDIVSGNNGSLQNGATFAPGRVAQAFSMDGVDDYVQFGDILDGLNGGFTLDAWIQTTATVGNKAIIAKYWTTGSSWVVRTNENDPRKVDFTVCSPSCESLEGHAVQLVSASDINDGAWHFIAATFDGATQRLYVDGVLEASATNTNPAWTDNHHFCIGSFCDSSGNSFSTFGGLIDEVEIYNRALSASEIQAIFAAGSAGKCKEVTVCHKPGTPTQKTLGIPIQALAGHLGHGDTTGPCQ
jgi:hypothetical protein